MSGASQVSTSQTLELVGSQPRLPQYAAQGSNGDFSMTRHDSREDTQLGLFGELDVAALLPDSHETGDGQLASDFPIRERFNWR